MGQTTPRVPPRNPSNSNPTPPKRSLGGPSNAVIVLRVIVIILFAAVGVVAGLIFRSPTARKYAKIIGGQIVHPKTPADVFPGMSTMNLMIIGRDYDYTDNDQIIKSNARSDLLMEAHLDYANNTVDLLSIPRDTRAEIPAWGRMAAHIGKINAAHAIGGPKLSEETVQNMFGISTDKYVAIDFVGFEKAIDELGGVDCVVDRKMDYDDNWGHLHIHLKPGFQHLTGSQAIGFVRYRHGDSDFFRVRRQQTLLTALKDKLRNPMILTKLGSVLDTLDNHMSTDLTLEQQVVLGNFFHSVPKEQIKMATLPSLETPGTFLLTDWPKATPMIQGIFGVTPPNHVASTEEVAPTRRHKRHRPA